MKLTTKSKYGISCMLLLAQKQEMLTIKDISTSLNISFKYTEAIFSALKKAFLVKSVRGNMGGYQLYKDSKDIHIYEIIHSLEQEQSIVSRTKKQNDLSRLLRREVYYPVDMEIKNYLKSISLDDIINKKSELY